MLLLLLNDNDDLRQRLEQEAAERKKETAELRDRLEKETNDLRDKLNNEIADRKVVPKHRKHYYKLFLMSNFRLIVTSYSERLMKMQAREKMKWMNYGT